MSQHHDNSHHVRRVTLPSGRAIDVVYFERGLAKAAHGIGVDLHVCPECAQELVYPVDWSEHGPVRWEVGLRCPNCAWETVGVFHQDVVDRFDEELDRGTDVLVRDLQRLTRANMEEELERFSCALAAGALLPEDF